MNVQTSDTDHELALAKVVLIIPLTFFDSTQYNKAVTEVNKNMMHYSAKYWKLKIKMELHHFLWQHQKDVGKLYE